MKIERMQVIVTPQKTLKPTFEVKVIIGAMGDYRLSASRSVTLSDDFQSLFHQLMVECERDIVEIVTQLQGEQIESHKP